jgi:5-methylcytosine-specific restriction endonuclease McrA
MSKKKRAAREAFRDAVFRRDKYLCQGADCVGKPTPREHDGPTKVTAHTLDAHHITDRTLMPNGGYVPENGISLCAACHQKAERFHESGGKEHERWYHPDDLYRTIGSSKVAAEEASKRLRT